MSPSRAAAPPRCVPTKAARWVSAVPGDMADHERLSCAIVAGRSGTPGGVIVETDHFHAHQVAAYPVAGQVIVAARRRVRLLTELTEAEASELLPLLRRVRRAQGEVLGIEHVCYFHDEDATHRFHVWMVPRYPWMAAFGRSIDSVRPALVHARDAMASPEELAEVRATAARLRKALRAG